MAINNSYETFNSKDPQEIVIDEFVGQMLPLIVIPIYETLYPSPKLHYCIIAFVIFRFFDILKPFPISYIDNNTQGALGIMMDDIAAGFFTIIILTIFFFYIGG
jgi:phosphatidylglycerophosphatase A|tara:strand:- start:177 stop:488 length:312 start_codon:yes stop_codon:yes gene_type:complete